MSIRPVATVLVWLILAGAIRAQFTAPTNFVRQASIRVTKTTGATRAFPATAAGLDSAVDALATNEILETVGGSYTLTDDLEFDVNGVTWLARGTTVTRAGDVCTVTGDDVTFDGLHTDGRIVVSSAERFKARGDFLFDGNAQAAAVRLENLSHDATFDGGNITRGTKGIYAVICNGTLINGTRIRNAVEDGVYLDFDTNQPTGFGGCGAAGVDASKYNPPQIHGAVIGYNGRYGVFAAYAHDLEIIGGSIEYNGQAGAAQYAGLYIKCPIQTRIVGVGFERNSGTASSSTRAEVMVEFGADEGEVGSPTPQTSVQIQDCHFGVYMHGIKVIAGSLSSCVYRGIISGNTFHLPLCDATIPSKAIWINEVQQTWDLLISGNNIPYNADQSADNQRGITIENTTADVNGSRITVQNNKTVGQVYGLALGRVDSVNVRHNEFRSHSGSGIINSSSENTIVFGNNFIGNTISNSGTTPSYVAYGNTPTSVDNVKAPDSDKLAGTTPTAAGLALLDDTDAAAQRTTLGLKMTRDVSCAATNPTDAQVLYFSTANAACTTTSLNRRVYVPFACRVTRAYVTSVQTAGTNEASTLAIRVNDTTDTTITSTLTHDATVTTANNTALNLSLAAGDYFSIKWTNPTYATNPTGVTLTIALELEPL